jgi:hypothetical protein
MNDNYRTVYDVPLPKGAGLEFVQNKRGLTVGVFIRGKNGKSLYVHSPDAIFSVSRCFLSTLASVARPSSRRSNKIHPRIVKRRIYAAWNHVFQDRPINADLAHALDNI